MATLDYMFMAEAWAYKIVQSSCTVCSHKTANISVKNFKVYTQSGKGSLTYTYKTAKIFSLNMITAMLPYLTKFEPLPSS
jgi:hypothetical protein